MLDSESRLGVTGPGAARLGSAGQGMAPLIDAFWSMPHLRDHLQPILAALPPEIIGKVSAYPERAAPSGGRLLLVASYPDLRSARMRPAVLVEHGSGQRYDQRRRHPSYSGGRHRESVQLFLVTNQATADANREHYPQARIEVIGCPRMVPWWESPIVPPEPVTIGLTFHWQGLNVAPEAGSALGWVTPHLAEVKAECERRGWHLLGTSHPRIWADARKVYQRHGIEHTPDPEAIFARCQVLCVDNSSMGWEFGSLDRPLVWLNPPSYRRDVDFPPRFWLHADSGVHCDDPAILPDCIREALRDAPAQRDARHRATDAIYKVRGPEGLERAVTAIVETAETWDEQAWTGRRSRRSM